MRAIKKRSERVIFFLKFEASLFDLRRLETYICHGSCRVPF